jgi:hypothetical protein
MSPLLNLLLPLLLQLMVSMNEPILLSATTSWWQDALIDFVVGILMPNLLQ